MAFWDTVSSELKKAAVEGWEAVKAGSKVAAGKSEEVAKTGKLRYKAYSVHKKADRLFGQLGGIVYEMAEPPFDNPLLRADVQKLIEEIKQVEQEAVSIDEEVERVKKSVSADASDVPYYYEAKGETKPEETGAGGEGSGKDKNNEEHTEADHACFSDCEGPCRCTEDTVVNSDMPEGDGDAVESHVYECPTDGGSSGGSSEESGEESGEEPGEDGGNDKDDGGEPESKD